MAEGQTPPVEGAAPGGAATPPQKPEGCPDKFWNVEKGEVMVEAWGKSRTELEQKLSAQGDALKTTKGAGLALPADAAPVIDDNAGVDEIVRAAGLDPIKVGQQFSEKGKLTVEQYAALRKAGFTRGIVEQHMGLQVRLMQAAQEKLVAEATGLVGGKTQLDTVLKWAKENLDDKTKTFYDGLATNPDTSIQGFEWLVGKYNVAVGAGKAQSLISGEGAPTPTGGYASQAEAHKAQNDPRYTDDTTYKKAVDARIAAMEMQVIQGRR